jgi:two-component system LytT family response regulator
MDINGVEMNKSKYPSIAINDGHGFTFIHGKEILYCLSEGGSTHLYMLDGSIVTVSKKLKEVGELLKDEAFVRVHHSHIINLLHLARFVNNNMNYVLMKNGEKLSVARSRKTELLNRFTKL